MIYFLPTVIVFLLESYLLYSWWRSWQKKDGKDKWFCLLGFVIGELYLLWEVLLVKQTGQPVSGSSEQKMLMARLVLGGSFGGLFTILGLFYLSFASFGQLKKTDKEM